MRDTRAATSSSTDGKFDVFATSGGKANSVKILAGGRLTTDQYDIAVEGLSAVGLPESGSVTIRTRRFDWAGQSGSVGEPVDLGLYTHTYSANKVCLERFSIVLVLRLTVWCSLRSLFGLLRLIQRMLSSSSSVLRRWFAHCGMDPRFIILVGKTVAVFQLLLFHYNNVSSYPLCCRSSCLFILVTNRKTLFFCFAPDPEVCFHNRAQCGGAATVFSPLRD